MKFDFHIDRHLRQRLIIASLVIALAVIFLPMLFDYYKVVLEKNIFIPQPPHISSVVTEKAEALITNTLSRSAETSLISKLFFKIFPKQTTDNSSANTNHEISNAEIKQPQSVSSEETETLSDKLSTPNLDQTMTLPEISKDSTNSLNHQTDTLHTKNSTQTALNHVSTKKELKPQLSSTTNYNLQIQSPLSSPSIRTNTSSSEEVIEFTNIKEGQSLSKQAKTYNQGWILQLGIFAQDHHAVQLVQKLRAHSFPAFISHHRNNGQSVYRVYVGPFTQKTDAENSRNSLQQKLQLSSIIVPFNPLDIT